jgi:hypothetical protein
VKKSLRIALTVAVLACLAPIALAAPGGGAPQPQVSELSKLSIAITAFLSLLGF